MPAPPESGALAPSSLVGRYRVLEVVAAGGMATVHVARDEGELDRLVALKCIHPHLATSREFIDMFLDEARIASRINHPNVCVIHDFGQDQGRYFIAMEYLVGQPVSSVLAALLRGGIHGREHESLNAILKITANAAEGLHAAHEARDPDGYALEVIHRDVSPQNLFVGYDGAVKVVDFGIARAAGRLYETRAGDTTLKGKLAYLAPEQLTGAEIDRRADVWALGVVLWEALTLRRLFRRDTEAETMAAVSQGAVPAPSTLRRDLPAVLDRIVLKALQRDRDLRYPTARAFAADLESFLAAERTPLGMAELAGWMGALFEDQRREDLAKLRSLTEHTHLGPAPAGAPPPPPKEPAARARGSAHGRAEVDHEAETRFIGPPVDDGGGPPRRHWPMRSRLALMAAGLASLPLAIVAGLALLGPATAEGTVFALAVITATLGALAAPFRSRRGLCRVAMVIAFGAVLYRLVAAGSGEHLTLTMEPGGGGGRLFDRVVPERDLALGGSLFVGMAKSSAASDPGLRPALRDAYSRMRRAEGSTPSPLLADLLLTPRGERYPTITIAPERFGPAPAALLFLHGHMGNLSVICWQVAQAANPIGLDVVCPSAGLEARWSAPEGLAIVEHSLETLRARGVERIYLGGLSAGAIEASRLANRVGVDGLVLVSGAASGAPPAQVPALVLHGRRDPLTSPAAARSFADRSPRARLHEVRDAGHWMVLSHHDEVRERLSAWLAEREGLSAGEEPSER